MNRTRGTGSVGGKPRSAEREPAKEKRRSRNGKQCTKNKKQRTRNGELSMENEQWKTRRTKRQRQRLPITLASGLSFITYRAIMHYLVQESLTSMVLSFCGARRYWSLQSIDLHTELELYRRRHELSGTHIIGLSFRTCVGYGPHGASSEQVLLDRSHMRYLLDIRYRYVRYVIYVYLRYS